MELTLERYSYRYGEETLSKKPAIMQEIESILLKPGAGLLTLSCERYVEMLRKDFREKGWENKPSFVDARGNITQVMDFRKEMVGVLLGLAAGSSPKDILGFQMARRSEDTEVEVGVYVVATASLQKQLEKMGKLWEGPDFEVARKGLSMAEFGSSMTVPVCLFGLAIRETVPQPINLGGMPPNVLKELVLTFLEAKYGSRILKNVRVNGKNRVLEFDGITRIEGKDIILALEMSESITQFPSRLRSGSIGDFAAMVREYEEIAGRRIRLRFILMGDFGSSFVERVFGKSGTAMAWGRDMHI
ncbi:MAG: hypothetical protein FJZ95_07345, partial [Chloroflexi bacterium]|nr:hypothetical protein [Chloroflexota bacterium]